MKKNQKLELKFKKSVITNLQSKSIIGGDQPISDPCVNTSAQNNCASGTPKCPVV